MQIKSTPSETIKRLKAFIPVPLLVNMSVPTKSSQKVTY